MRFPISCLIGLALCLLMVSISKADGVFLDGLSARTIGRGGANLAHWDNGSILHDNPAGIAHIEGDVLFEVGGTMLFTDFNYSDPQNARASVSQLYAMPEFSFIKRDGDWAYGIGVFAPAGFGSRFYLEGPGGLLAGEQLYKSFGTLGRVLPGLSYKLTDRLSVGGTLGVAVMVADLEGPYILQNSVLPGTPTLIDLDAGGAALSWSAGLSYQLTDQTSFGVAFQSENRFKAHGTMHVEVPTVGEADYDTRMHITWPRSVGVGIRHELCPHRILSVDLVWYDWSSAFDTIGLRLSGSGNPFFPAINEQFPLHWRDSLSTRVGYEIRMDNFQTLRFGYVHHRSPIPAGTLTPYIPAALEHAFATGYGWRVFGWNLDLAYMFSFGPTVHTGTSDFIGGDFDDSDSWDRTHALALTLMRTW